MHSQRNSRHRGTVGTEEQWAQRNRGHRGTVLKEMSRNLKLQLQKKRRIMRAANLMDDEDLQWVLRERERARLNAATNQSGERIPEGDNANRNRNDEPEG